MIYVLPGMGADSRMYSAEWRCLPQSQFLDWPRDWAGSSITDLASRVVDDASIFDGATLIGSSLGGIVACEIATIRKIDRLFLVGSAKKKEEVSAILRTLHPLVDLAPIRFVQQVCGKLPSDLGEMFSGAEPGFIRAMCRAIFHWEGFQSGSTIVRRIHGMHDRIIPSPNDGEHLVDGGHLIAMTHAEICVRWIEEAIKGDKIANPKEEP